MKLLIFSCTALFMTSCATYTATVDVPLDAKHKTIAFPYAGASILSDIKSTLKQQGWKTYVSTGIASEKDGDKSITQYHSDAKYKFIADVQPASDIEYQYITASIIDNKTGQELICTEGRRIMSKDFAQKFGQTISENTN